MRESNKIAESIYETVHEVMPNDYQAALFIEELGGLVRVNDYITFEKNNYVWLVTKSEASSKSLKQFDPHREWFKIVPKLKSLSVKEMATILDQQPWTEYDGKGDW